LANQDLEILKKTVDLNRQSFLTELQTKRRLDAEMASRMAGDARSQFGIGAIGGAGLAGAEQSLLSANIAERGVQKGDYKTGFDLAIRRNFQRNQYDVFQSTISAVDELSSSLREGLKTALADTIMQARSARDAFAGLANALSRLALEKGLDMFFNAALSKINFKNKGGSVKGYNTGGLVTGGSNANADTVPAMLSSGEFVMRRSAVNRIGVANLAAINNGGFAGLASGGYANINLNNSTEFLGNPSRPTGMRFNIDPSLSSYALTSRMNRQNQLRDEKAKQYFSYRQNQMRAMQAYKKEIRGRRMGAIIGAATAFGGAAIGSMSSAAPSSNYDPMMDVSRNPDAGWSPNIITSNSYLNRNAGGSIPSMLTQGEFVINRQAASRIGSGALGRMNSGAMSFNSGGSTSSINSQENGTDRVVDAIKELKTVFEKTPSGQTRSVTQDEKGKNVNITVPISISVNSGGETEPKSETARGNATEEQDDTKAASKQLGETMRAVVLQELEKQKRPGGMLYNL